MSEGGTAGRNGSSARWHGATGWEQRNRHLPESGEVGREGRNGSPGAPRADGEQWLREGADRGASPGSLCRTASSAPPPTCCLLCRPGTRSGRRDAEVTLGKHGAHPQTRSAAANAAVSAESPPPGSARPAPPKAGSQRPLAAWRSATAVIGGRGGESGGCSAWRREKDRCGLPVAEGGS